MPLTVFHTWIRESGIRLEGSHSLDSSKVQSPCVVQKPHGGFRMYYTAIGPGRPFSGCQGYLLSAVSDDGLHFQKEPGIRLAPEPGHPQFSLRVIAPTVISLPGGGWRMYFEARGPASQPTVVCSAVSVDQLHWHPEPGVRLHTPGGVGGPRVVQIGDGRLRIYCFCTEFGPGGIVTGQRVSSSVISAVATDGLNFQPEQGYRLRDRQTTADSAGITAAEVVPPEQPGELWTMFYSAWQDVPPGTIVPHHPSLNTPSVSDSNAIQASNTPGDDFAAASIASDISGYRSRILMAQSEDGLVWNRHCCVIDGDGYDSNSADAVHAEDMSVVRVNSEQLRMYYAACDRRGNWRILSALSGPVPV